MDNLNQPLKSFFLFFLAVIVVGSCTNNATLKDVTIELEANDKPLILAKNTNTTFTGKEWNTLEIIEINKLPPRSTFVSLSTKAAADDLVSDRHFFLDKARLNRPDDIEGNKIRKEDVSKQRWFATIRDNDAFLLLNGEWRFNWVKAPALAPKNFHKTSYQENSSWDNFLVPANWGYHANTKEAISAIKYNLAKKNPFFLQTEMMGKKKFAKKVYKRYGTPIYVNHPYEFVDLNNPTNAKPIPGFNPYSGKQPNAPTNYNPVGSYRKSVVLPKSWEGKRILFHVGAAKAALYLWVNGKVVGYSEGSKTPAEFDITPFVELGKANLIAMQIYRWSNGTYLECQDFWRVSGIERDVYINAVPKSHIYDYSISTPLEASKNKNTTRSANLHTRLTLANTTSKMATHMLTVTLKDVGSATPESTEKDIPTMWTQTFTVRVPANDVKIVVIKKRISHNVNLWSANHPYLYHLQIASLVKGEQEQKEVISKRIGFRTVKVKGYNVLVNNKKILLLGANRHEHEPANVHVISRQSMAYDAIIMKTNNLNSVRNSHYPTDPYWYEMCDRIGIYVLDEANVESHGVGYRVNETLGNKTNWIPAHVKRIRAMAERTKNSPSVILWSMGNEAGDGIGFKTAGFWLKGHHNARPVFYGLQAPKDSPEYRDINVEMYYPSRLMQRGARGWAANKAFLLHEYNHAMGNSSGALSEYLEAFRKYPKLLGGMIWDWVDQGILRWQDKEGLPYYAYGGGFGPDNIPTDGNFCLNGIVKPDREPSPSIPEVALWYGMQVEFDSKKMKVGELKVIGDTPFVLANTYALKWELVIDGMNKLLEGEKEFRFSAGDILNAKQTKKSKRVSNGNRYAKTIRISEINAAGLKKIAKQIIAQNKASRGDGISYPLSPARYFLNVSIYRKSISSANKLQTYPYGKQYNYFPYHNFSALINSLGEKWVVGRGQVELPTGQVDEILATYQKEFADTAPIKESGIFYPSLSQGEVKPLNVSESAKSIVVSGALRSPQYDKDGNFNKKSSFDGFTFTFNKSRGYLENYSYKGKKLLKNPLRLNFWRSPVDNENAERGSKGKPGFSELAHKQWYNIANRLKAKMEVKQKTDGKVVIESTIDVIDFIYKKGNVLGKVVIRYEVTANGLLVVDNAYLGKKSKARYKFDMPRFGMVADFDVYFNDVYWYGRGPTETYSDRKYNAFFGVYQGRVADQTFSYTRPQETGNKTDVYWLAITEKTTSKTPLSMMLGYLPTPKNDKFVKDNKANRIKTTEDLSVNVSHYSMADYKKIGEEPVITGLWGYKKTKQDANYYELVALLQKRMAQNNVDTTVYIDYEQRGLGGQNSWGSTPLKAYRLYTTSSFRHRFVLTCRPIVADIEYKKFFDQWYKTTTAKLEQKK